MADTSRSTSPDPITQPSSPTNLGSTNVKTSTKPLPGRRRPRLRAAKQLQSAESAIIASPSKTFLLEPELSTNANVMSAGGGSPWRLRVTVSAEPNNTNNHNANTAFDSSPARQKVARTVKVPLKGADENGVGSPVKCKATPKKSSHVALALSTSEHGDVVVESAASVAPISKKRRGTPVRRRSARVAKAAATAEAFALDMTNKAESEEVVQATEAGEEAIQLSTAASATESRARNATPARRKGGQVTQRTRRLTQAREELDHALRDAVGPSAASRQTPRTHTLTEVGSATRQGLAEEGDVVEGASDPHHNSDRQPSSSFSSNGGDDGQNEDEDEEQVEEEAHDEDFDFTMVSVETLQSMRQGQNSSLLLDDSGANIVDGNGDSVGNDHENSQRRRSGLSVSYMPSSPPSFASHSRNRAANEVDAKDEGMERDNAVYPDISAHALGAPVAASAPDGSIRNSAARSSHVQSSIASRSSRRHAKNTSFNGKEQLAKQTHGAEDAEEGEDIWAEEASRSLEDSDQNETEHEHPDSRPIKQHQQQQHLPPQRPQPSTSTSNPPRLADLFGSDAQPPPRSKIPRTWRRSSGVGFSYADSPAPEPGIEGLRKASGTSTEEDRAGGVLTPPSTDNEAGVSNELHGNGEEEADSSMGMSTDASARSAFEHEGEADTSDLDFTHPDGVGTQLEHSALPSTKDGRASAARKRKSDIQADRNVNGDSPVPDVDADADADADGPDTGLFWQTNLPNIYRTRQAQRPRFTRPKRAMDLSELLALEGSSPAKKPAVEIVGVKSPVVQISRVTEQVIRPAALLQPMSVKEKVLASPLRRSLLKSSKIGWPGLPSVEQASRGVVQIRQLEVAAVEQSSIVESFDSRASDQRQLQGEMDAAALEPTYCEAKSDYTRTGLGEDSITGAEDDEEEMEYSSEYKDEEDTTRADISQSIRSYEEHLNIESPQKIRVKFGDSTVTTAQESSVLEAKRQYPPLFSQSAPRITAGTSKVGASDPAPPQRQPHQALEQAAQQPSLLNRLTTTLWTTLIRPTGPSSVTPASIPVPSPSLTEPEPIYSPLLRHEIRARYGVVPNQHPWTMTHMRTLHRLLNSCTSGRYDSIVPESGPLPSQLKPLINRKITSITPSWTFTFTAQHGQVVEAFMQTLVEPHITDAIKDGSVDFVGDRAAWVHRGWFGDRHGDFVVFEHEEGVVEPKDGVSIGREWVARAVGNCIWGDWLAQEAEKENGMDVQRRKGEIEGRRREWERRNGVVHDDDDEHDWDDDR